ncbi:YdcF family protein [Priestia flexa]|uniref:YdcF family protein n=1 Tax=Priestia flexa TaxID=86664 RepID=UPI001A8EB20F|nr:YdcF family protein [Priestia flexa]MBN8436416.1 YdcF family protein [Priestia flexa]MCA0968949.1 YdcF family protein [Priestia flexa]
MNKIQFLVSYLIVYCLILLTSIYLYSYESLHTPKSSKRDAAIVLGAAAWNDKPSPVFQERINYAINLYKNKKVKYIVFTGGKSKEAPFTEAQVAKKYAMEKGVLEEDILTENKSRITEENIINSKIILKEYKIKTVYLVSDPLHMLRSITIAHTNNIKAYPAPTPTTKYQSFKSQFTFLTREAFYFSGYLYYKFLIK